MSIRETLAEHHEDLLFLDPPSQFDSAILGVATRCGSPPLVVYDTDKVLEALMAEGMSQDDAEEWFSFNIEGAYMGPQTPMYLARVETYVD